MIFIIKKIIKSKTYTHLFSFIILALPLATFILFDLRHEFIQLKSIIRYVSGEPGKMREHIDYLAMAATRVGELLHILPFIFNVFFVVLLVLFYRFAPKRKHSLVSYFLIFFIGFWILTLPLKGTIYDYYYWAFLPLFIMTVVYCISSLAEKYAPVFFAVLIVILLVNNTQQIIKQDKTFFATNTGLWNFYSSQAKEIYKDANTDFGWYVYTADQYAYSFKYAMSYMQQKNPSIHAARFEKKPLTYLMIYPSDSIYTNEAGWKTGQVKISKKPMKVLKNIGGSYAEKYILTQEEQAVQSDSSLLDDLRFR